MAPLRTEFNELLGFNMDYDGNSTSARTKARHCADGAILSHGS